LNPLLKKLFRQLATQPAPIRILGFTLILLLLWAPLALPIQWLVIDQNLVSLLTMPILYFLFLGLLKVWGHWVHDRPNLLQDYGMRQPYRWLYEWMGGLGIGYGVVLLLFILQGAIGWVRWLNPLVPLPKLMLEGLIVAVFFGLAEEIFFRGWLLDELERDYKPNLALGISSIVYALLHCLRLVPASIQLIALTFLGLTLGLAKRLTGDRLGLSAGLHSGLVWGYYVLNVGQFIQYSDQAPDWLTGLERNPLAGLLGILTMAILFISLTIARQRQVSNKIKPNL
jgi:uncharacterized protein